MTPENRKSAPAKNTPVKSAAPAPATTASPTVKPPPLFRRIDWLAFLLTSLLVFLGYFFTISPDLTLEDSGELAVASMYAGVPHPPGYPVWTVYSWLFTVLLPIGNIAYRVAISSAVAGALSCGLIALMVSRGSSMMIEGIAELKNIEQRVESGICLMTGFVAGMLMGFDGFMWSQAVIVEVYTLTVLSMTGMMCCMLRWIYAPHQYRYLYFAWFLFGICTNNHQSLLVTAISLEVIIVAALPKLGRDLCLGNVLLLVAILVGKALGIVSVLNDNTPLLLIFTVILIASFIGFVALSIKTKKVGTTFHIGFVCFLALVAGALCYLYMPVASMTNPPLNWGYPRTETGFWHALTRGQYERIHPMVGTGDNFIELMSSFLARYTQSLGILIDGDIEEFNPAYLLLGLVALVPFFYIRKLSEKETLWFKCLTIFHLVLAALLMLRVCLYLPLVKGEIFSMEQIVFWITTVGILYELCLVVFFLRWLQKRERAWLIGLMAFYLVLAPFLVILLNPATDRQALSLNKPFFTASHVLVAMGIGYGLTLLLAVLATQYQRFRVPILCAFGVLTAAALAYFAFTLREETPYFIVRLTAGFGLALAALISIILLVSRQRMPAMALLGAFALMPAYSVLSHWSANEQRGHLFGYWFGHDMFTPPFNGADGKPIYPEMDKNTILFGGTDPGRFCPTYMIFCESQIPPEKKRDPKFDRRDVYLITQNALADGTYLNYIRAHYNRSTQPDPAFFSELARSDKESQLNYKTNLLARMVLPLDKLFLANGDRIEKNRRVGNSFFQSDHFTDLPGLAAKLKGADPLAKFLTEKLSAETRTLLGAGDSPGLRKALAADLNLLIDGPEMIFTNDRFQNVRLSEYVQQFIVENPQSHTRVRLNRLLLEEAFPKEFSKSQGGVYPDREIQTPTVRDSEICFAEYMADATRRIEHDTRFPNEPRQIKPGEDVRRVRDGNNERVQVSGQVAVMAINGLLTKVIFDKNTNNSFYVEESFPLDWMYPHLSPYGIIMKINRQPLREIDQTMVDKDHDFWSQFSQRLIGNWITYDTPLSNICDFAERLYVRHDYKDFKGDTKFIRDDDGQKAFSKLRSSIAGVYQWRLSDCTAKLTALASKPAAEQQALAGERNRLILEQQRMLKEAEFAFKQAYAFCPYSPEALYRYVNLLLGSNRIEDAWRLAVTSQKLDPYNGQLEGLVKQLDGMRARVAAAQTAPTPVAISQLVKLEAEYRANPNNISNAVQLAIKLAEQGLSQTNRVLEIANRIVANPKADAATINFTVQIYQQLQVYPGMEIALTRLATLTSLPEDWMNVVAIQAFLNRPQQAISSLKQTLALNAQRLKADPKAANLATNLATDPRLASLRTLAEFQQILATNR